MKNIFLVFLCLLVIPETMTLAQKPGANDGPVGIFDSGRDYDEFMRAVKTSAAQNPEMRPLIAMLNDIALGKPVGSTSKQYGIESSVMGLLADPSIRQELEMVDSQYEELKGTGCQYSGTRRRTTSTDRSVGFG